MGVPVIASDLATFRHHFTDAALRFVPGDDPAALARAVIELAADPEGTVAMGVEAQRQADRVRLGAPEGALPRRRRPPGRPLAPPRRREGRCARLAALAHRGVDQSGRSPALGAGGRRFESGRPDHSPSDQAEPLPSVADADRPDLRRGARREPGGHPARAPLRASGTACSISRTPSARSTSFPCRGWAASRSPSPSRVALGFAAVATNDLNAIGIPAAEPCAGDPGRRGAPGRRRRDRRRPRHAGAREALLAGRRRRARLRARAQPRAAQPAVGHRPPRLAGAAADRRLDRPDHQRDQPDRRPRRPGRRGRADRARRVRAPVRFGRGRPDAADHRRRRAARPSASSPTTCIPPRSSWATPGRCSSGSWSGPSRSR